MTSDFTQDERRGKSPGLVAINPSIMALEHPPVASLDPRLERAFAWHKRKHQWLTLLRVLFLMAALTAAILVHHWAGWLVFALLAVLAALPLFATAILIPRETRRFHEWLRAHPSALTWVHIAPEVIRKSFRRVELRTRDGEFCYLFLPESMARDTVEAAAAMPGSPLVTRTAEEYAVQLPAHEHDAELVKLEDALAAQDSPLARTIGPALVELLARWRKARSTAGSAAAAEVEQHVKQLVVLLMAARSYGDVMRRREEELGPMAAIFEPKGVPYEKEASEPLGKIRAAVERCGPPHSD